MANCLVLACSDYKFHLTPEGEELQAGLELAGWTLAGFGYSNSHVAIPQDVPQLLDYYQPKVVLVSAREDWDRDSPGCFDKRCSFVGIEALANRPDIFKIAVVKDCPGNYDRRENWCKEIKADAVLLYYHPRSMLAVSPWLRNYQLVRTWHTVDGDYCRKLLESPQERSAAVVSGATGYHYPLRSMAFSRARRIGLATWQHPGYRDRQCHSQEYLKMLSGYKVHLATASIYGFALHKIIESVAVGCVAVTNLPDFDVLPEIDDALIRISNNQTPESLRLLIEGTVEMYNAEERKQWALRCLDFYDWRVRGKVLSEELKALATS